MKTEDRYKIAMQVYGEMNELCKADPEWPEQITFNKEGAIESIGCCLALQFYNENYKLGRLDETTKVIGVEQTKKWYDQIAATEKDEKKKKIFSKYGDCLEKCTDGTYKVPDIKVDTSSPPPPVTVEGAELAKKSFQLQSCAMTCSLPKGVTIQQSYTSMKAELEWMRKAAKSAVDPAGKKPTLDEIIKAMKDSGSYQVMVECYKETSEMCSKVDPNFTENVKFVGGAMKKVGFCLAHISYCANSKLKMMDNDGILDVNKLIETFNKSPVPMPEKEKAEKLAKLTACEKEENQPKFEVDVPKELPAEVTANQEKEVKSLRIQTCTLLAIYPDNQLEESHKMMSDIYGYIKKELEATPPPVLP